MISRLVPGGNPPNTNVVRPCGSGAGAGDARGAASIDICHALFFGKVGTALPTRHGDGNGLNVSGFVFVGVGVVGHVGRLGGDAKSERATSESVIIYSIVVRPFFFFHRCFLIFNMMVDIILISL